VNTTLPALRRAESEAEARYLEARTAYLVSPHEAQRQTMREAAAAWGAAQDVLNEALDAVRRATAAEAMA
jgi:hypothetical protein